MSWLWNRFFFIESYNLRWLIKTLTRITASTSALLDNVITNSEGEHAAGTIQTGLSDHLAIFVKLITDRIFIGERNFTDRRTFSVLNKLAFN